MLSLGNSSLLCIEIITYSCNLSVVMTINYTKRKVTCFVPCTVAGPHARASPDVRELGTQDSRGRSNGATHTVALSNPALDGEHVGLRYPASMAATAAVQVGPDRGSIFSSHTVLHGLGWHNLCGETLLG